MTDRWLRNRYDVLIVQSEKKHVFLVEDESHVSCAYRSTKCLVCAIPKKVSRIVSFTSP